MTDIANQESIYLRRNESFSHVCVIKDANDTTAVNNVGTGGPLYERKARESSYETENRTDNSNVLDTDDDGLGIDAPWFPKEYSDGLLSVKLD